MAASIRDTDPAWKLRQDAEDWRRAGEQLAGQCWDEAGVEVEVDVEGDEPPRIRIHTTPTGPVIVVHASTISAIDTARAVLAERFAIGL